jgi:hypothetical protein
MFAAVGGLVAADAAFAKIDVDKLTLGGEARIRGEYRNGAAFGTNATTSTALGQNGCAANGGVAAQCNGGNANESALSSRIRVNVGYDLTPDVSFFAQIQDARLWGSEGSVPATTSGIAAVSSSNNNGTGVDLHQGYILVKNILTPGLSAKVGRQEIIFGDHRLFGNFGWSQIGNAFDALRLTHSTAFMDVDLFYAKIAETETTGANHGVVFNGAGVKGTSDQDIYGLYVTLKPVPNWTLEPYYFLLKDSRPVVAGAFITTPQAMDQARNVLGGRLNGKAGGLDTTFEAVWQFGGISSGQAPSGNLGTHDMHINAHAEAFKLGYTFEPVPMKPRIGIEVDYASGDNCVNGTGAASCRAKGHYNTFDNLYPTNHFHYGYMDLMSWRNMVDYMLVFDVKPDPVSKVQVNFILHRLARAQDNWYRAGQVIYATSCGPGVAGCVGGGNTAQSLGKELDIHYFRTFKEKFKFEVGYGHFWTGQYFDHNPGKNPTGGNGPISTLTFNQDSGQNWGYVMGSVLF